MMFSRHVAGGRRGHFSSVDLAVYVSSKKEGRIEAEKCVKQAHGATKEQGGTRH